MRCSVAFCSLFKGFKQCIYDGEFAVMTMLYCLNLSTGTKFFIQCHFALDALAESDYEK